MEGYTAYRRPSARPRRVSEIKTADEQIQVVGTIVDKSEAELVIDDGTGTLPVLFEETGLPENAEVGTKVRVFGTPLNVKDSHELHAEIIQKLDNLDLGLYKEVRHETKKFEKKVEQLYEENDEVES
ncbi:MAG: hypothetical protein KGY45_00935 [Hadesarchaea archaeon]|nr:hypothetical protein [Hadesarchaea archaeon]